jgi:hypothetical protein
MVDWEALREREARRYADGLSRLPEDPDARQRQLVRTANAAFGAGSALLMAGGDDEGARTWLLRAAELYRASFPNAPAESWGRALGAIKSRLLAGDGDGARRDARWALDQRPDASESPIGRYAAVLALLVLGQDARAEPIARGLQDEPPERFPAEVADAVAGLARGDATLYVAGVSATLRSFEARTEYLEDVPIADTVLVLERLAEARGLAVHPRSALLGAT